MAAYHLNLVGIVFDIIGVFLLAVEAIKLENLRKLRDKVLIPLHHSVLPATIQIPRSVRKNRRWRHDPDWIVIEPYERSQFQRTFRHFYLSHYLGGMFGTLLIVIMLRLFGLSILGLIRNSVSARDMAIFLVVHIVFTLVSFVMIDLTANMFPMTIIPFFIAAIFMFYPPTLVFMLMGEALHFGGINLSKAIISCLNFIDRKSPDGTIGIIGFLLALIGFILQFTGTWAGGTSPNPNTQQLIQPDSIGGYFLLLLNSIVGCLSLTG